MGRKVLILSTYLDIDQKLNYFYANFTIPTWDYYHSFLAMIPPLFYLFFGMETFYITHYKLQKTHYFLLFTCQYNTNNYTTLFKQ